MMVEITPIALRNIGYKFYIILAVFNAVDAVIIYFLFPETKGLSLEEIDFSFAEKSVALSAKTRDLNPVAEKTEVGGTVVEWTETA